MFNLRQTKLLSKSATRLLLGGLILFYFSGYQPTWAIPPLQQQVVRAEFAEQQDISAASFSEPFNLPHPGYLTTRFSKLHPGIDIAAGFGMPVHPITKGKVAEVSLGFWGLGHFVVLEHEQGLRSTYGHLDKIFVRPGDSLESSSILGTVGMTGQTSGPHTHLEVAREGHYIDPLTILPQITNWPADAQNPPRGAGDANTQTSPPQKINPQPVKPKLPLIDISQAGSGEQNLQLTQLFRLPWLSLE